MSPSHPHFSIHASVVFQLGENLVTDATQALLELVKNTYDADATYCKLVIDTKFESADGFGQITVEDDGIGMDDFTIQRGWLTISDSPKREFKRQHKTTGRGRTPLGDKGLGRLGTQRLGNTLEIETRTGDGTERTLRIDWGEFASGELLENIPVSLRERKSSRPKGTTLKITGLRDIQKWRSTGRDTLPGELSRVISPYFPIKQFDFVAIYDGEQIDLLEFGQKLKESALINYRLRYSDQMLVVDGRIRLDYMMADNRGKRARELFNSLLRRDEGREFFDYLKLQKGENRFSFYKEQGRWWIGFQSKEELDEIDKIETVETTTPDPGPFQGEIDYLSLGNEAASVQTAFKDAQTYKRIVQELSGIRVYRDGFGIKLSDDWLNLGRQWTSQGSYYSLKPQNTLGYVAISALHNSCLEEKTDREGFIDNPEYRNFYALLANFVDYAANSQEFLRRSWNAFKNHKALLDANVEPHAQPEDLSASLRSTIGRAANYRLVMTRMSQALSKASTDAALLLESKRKGETSASLSAFQEILGRLTAVVAEARALLADLDSYLRELTEKEKLLELIAEQTEALREQMRRMNEVIALGLTAEALSHELSSITDDMAHKSDQIIKYIRSSGPRDQRIISYTDHIKSVISGIRKQLSYLAPSLQYVRERRDEIDLGEFFNDIMKYHIAAFSAERISMRIFGEKFKVRFNRGKLIQVFENLISNAEYWLKEDLRMNRIRFGTITIELQRPVVIVGDNGRGIDPKLEDSIFEPFVSGKGRGKGRGLGLFIVQQLLENENCNIGLLPERNGEGRLWRFEIDLRGALNA